MQNSVVFVVVVDVVIVVADGDVVDDVVVPVVVVVLSVCFSWLECLITNHCYLKYSAVCLFVCLSVCLSVCLLLTMPTSPCAVFSGQITERSTVILFLDVLGTVFNQILAPWIACSIQYTRLQILLTRTTFINYNANQRNLGFSW